MSEFVLLTLQKNKFLSTFIMSRCYKATACKRRSLWTNAIITYSPYPAVSSHFLAFLFCFDYLQLFPVITCNFQPFSAISRSFHELIALSCFSIKISQFQIITSLSAVSTHFKPFYLQPFPAHSTNFQPFPDMSKCFQPFSSISNKKQPFQTLSRYLTDPVQPELFYKQAHHSFIH